MQITDAVLNAAIRTSTGIDGDFVNDLNACHEMEKHMTQGEKTSYVYWLQSLMKGAHFGDNYFATARQRAEAFARVKRIL